MVSDSDVYFLRRVKNGGLPQSNLSIDEEKQNWVDLSMVSPTQPLAASESLTQSQVMNAICIDNTPTLKM